MCSGDLPYPLHLALPRSPSASCPQLAPQPPNASPRTSAPHPTSLAMQERDGAGGEKGDLHGRSHGRGDASSAHGADDAEANSLRLDLETRHQDSCGGDRGGGASDGA